LQQIGNCKRDSGIVSSSRDLSRTFYKLKKESKLYPASLILAQLRRLITLLGNNSVLRPVLVEMGNFLERKS
jgi:hypothetical protein